MVWIPIWQMVRKHYCNKSSRAFTWRKSPRRGFLKLYVTEKCRQCFYVHDFLCSKSASDPWKKIFFSLQGKFCRRNTIHSKTHKTTLQEFQKSKYFLFLLYLHPTCLFGWLVFFLNKFFAFLCWNNIIWETSQSCLFTNIMQLRNK